MTEPPTTNGDTIAPSLDRGLPFGGRDVLCMAVIVLAVLILGAPGITQGGLGWSDAPSHTFDGIFVLEFVKQLPLDNPRAWAERFYLHCPALGIVVYWPPGFAVVEAAFFALFGISIVTARVTVLLFAVGAGLLMFSLGKRWFDRSTGLFAALLLISCPHGALWLGDVMLEWPATFWILAAVYAYQAHRDTGKTRWTIALAAAIAMAFFTKQTAGLILPIIFLHAVVAQASRLCLRAIVAQASRLCLRAIVAQASRLCPHRRDGGATRVNGGATRVNGGATRVLGCTPGRTFIVSMAVSLVFITAYLLLTRKVTALPSQLLTPSLNFSGFFRWPAEILGWPLMPVALIGLGTLVLKPDRAARALLLIWFAAWTAFCLVISAKEPRYLFFAVPPLAFAAVRFFIPAPAPGRREQRLTWNRDAPRFVMLIALVLAQTILARVKSTGRLPTYAGAVAELAASPDADLVLVDAVRDGQFVFDVFQNPDARNRIIPLRASKFLYARAARMAYSPQVFVKSEQDILDLLDEYGIRYIVIESALPKTQYVDADPPPRRLLRRLLRTDPRFTLLQAWPLRCDDPIWDDVELRLYAYSDCPPRTSDTITLSFPGMARTITFQLP